MSTLFASDKIVEVYDMTVIDICQSVFANRYSVFQLPNRVGKIQFLIENTTVTAFTQIFDYGITLIYEKINSSTVI